MGEISITKLLVVAALVVLLFGTKKLRTLGGDLGAAIKGFKKAMNDDDAAAKKGADVDLQAEKLSHKEGRGEQDAPSISCSIQKTRFKKRVFYQTDVSNYYRIT